ncbi:hypothetical protein FIBSPDRAFT_883668 [Athelia psychrophila]|uniref:Uncharacterized protein n=1 Tax=Athelia psychrophila TaxID=1759441 RepID=A0A166TTE4_9AGAM|nr:hypothetical protein FIBSPDRAFT_883668 [Fibularhizoctonia sp. CBS 109695]
MADDVERVTSRNRKGKHASGVCEIYEGALSVMGLIFSQLPFYMVSVALAVTCAVNGDITALRISGFTLFVSTPSTKPIRTETAISSGSNGRTVHSYWEQNQWGSRVLLCVRPLGQTRHEKMDQE